VLDPSFYFFQLFFFVIIIIIIFCAGEGKCLSGAHAVVT